MQKKSICGIYGILIAFFIIFCLFCSSFAQTPIEKGTQWLELMQLPDGGWAGQDYLSESDYYTSIYCLYAMFNGNYDINDPVCQNAYSYIRSLTNGSGSWFNDMRSTVLGMLGCFAFGEDVSLNKQWILGKVQPDGSFAQGDLDQKRYDTGWAIIGLVLTGTNANDTIIQNAKNFIIQHQDANGSFYSNPWNPAVPTGQIAYALILAGMDITSPQIAAAIEFIRSKQHPDGGWGHIIPSHPGDTGLVLALLISLGVDKSDPLIQNSATYLVNKQNDDGSWPDPWASTRAQCQTNRAIIGLATMNGYPAPFGEIMNYFAILPIEATIEFRPKRLNIKSRGKYVTCYIELPFEYNVANIDISTVKIININNREVEIWAELHPTNVGDFDNDGITDLMVKFKRSSVINALDDLRGSVELKVSGEIAREIFEGTGVINVSNKKPHQFSNPDELYSVKSFSVYPNPFNPTTTISFSIQEKEIVRLTVFDLLGRQVSTLIAKTLERGDYHIPFNGSNLPSGIYLCRLSFNNKTFYKRILLMK